MADDEKDTRDRKTRLSAALRANLARRKQQARQRRAGTPETAPGGVGPDAARPGGAGPDGAGPDGAGPAGKTPKDGTSEPDPPKE